MFSIVQLVLKQLPVTYTMIWKIIFVIYIYIYLYMKKTWEKFFKSITETSFFVQIIKILFSIMYELGSETLLG